MTDQERFRLSVFYGNVLRHWQYVHYQFYGDALDEEMWLGQRNYFAMVLSQDIGLVAHWRSTQAHYSTRFNKLMQSIVTQAE